MKFAIRYSPFAIRKTKSKWQMANGFTLIELLVVIAILGVLIGVSAISYTTAQAKSRDSRRKTDLDSLKKALELAKTDTAGSYYYPGCNPCTDGPSSASPALATTYIPAIPKDPKTSADYIYAPLDSSNAACTATCTKYTLTACLENGNDYQKDASKNAACSTPASYSVKST